MRGHHNIMYINKIIKFFLITNLIVFIVGHTVGFDKSYWIDEVVAINYGLNNLNYNNLKLDIKYAPGVVNERTSKRGAIVLIGNN